MDERSQSDRIKRDFDAVDRARREALLAAIFRGESLDAAYEASQRVFLRWLFTGEISVA